MAKYLLEKDFELCGWEGLPFALRYPNGAVDFFDRESYVPVLFSDGNHEMTKESLSEKQWNMLDRLLKMNIVRECTKGETLEKSQEYVQFGCQYKRDVQWSITGKCNYKCRHCLMSAPEGLLGEPTKEQCLKVIEDMADCGIRLVGITGGEPLISPYLPFILEELTKRRIRVSTIYSNGALLNEDVLEMCAERGQYPSVQLSFDGIGWHDWLRGIDGAEKEVRRALEMLKKRNVEVSVSMCLHKHNLSVLEDSLKLMADYGVIGVKSNIASPIGEWASQTEHFLSQDETYAFFMDFIPRYMEGCVSIPVQLDGMFRCDIDREGKRRISIPFARFSGKEEALKLPACAAMKQSMYIGPDGYVLPCMTMAGSGLEKEFPNVFETPLKEILCQSNYCSACRIRAGEVVNGNERCAECAYKTICGGGCRALGYLDGRRVDGIDESCCAFFKNGWFEKVTELIDRYKV